MRRRRIARVCTALGLGLLASVAVVRAGQVSIAPQDRDPDVARWFEAVNRHSPGLKDASIATVMSLSPLTFAQVNRILADRRRSAASGPDSSFNQFLHRAALLHMDAAMVAADEITVAEPPRAPRTSSVRGAGRGTASVLTRDGGFDGLAGTGIQWEYGRALVDLTLPRPAEAPTARQWYLSAGAFLSNRSLLADLRAHLVKGREMFPDDPDMLFASGSYYEALASPRIRPIIDAPLPAGIQIAAPSERASWRLAEDFYRRAAAVRPDFAAARIRQARALHMLGRADEAVRELREAVALTSDPALLYYAALFEGGAQEALGDVPAARASYERAAQLFPRAQSPYLSLSRLARDRGDRVAALAAAQHVFTRAVESELDDPWWTYFLWFVRDADERLAQLRRSLAPEARAR